MHKIIHYTIFLFLFSIQISAQTNSTKVEIIRFKTPPIIDANIEINEWKDSPALNNFVQYVPFNGKPATEKTEVKIGYDNTAIYISAYLYDSVPSKITRLVSSRDEIDKGINDLFSIIISPYNDNNNAYSFVVSSTGTQQDEKCLYVGGQDQSWNSVWESAVKITNDGWITEIKIPFAALRFSSDEVQNWGFNVWRRQNRLDEWTSWNYVDNKIGYFYSNNGLITGLKNITPPTRLSFMPYVSAYTEKSSTDKWTSSFNAGMDIKYGINESYTLDMILIPDFGQVQSDDQQLNLTPYEIKFDENRQFFTEGVELFNKGGVFYSRRIGSTPAGFWNVHNSLNTDEVIQKNPTETKLINSIKLSGKNSNGLAIGFLNAMTSAAEATIKNIKTGKAREIETQGFTNYNMLVIDKQLSQNSFLSFANTNVIRKDFLANVFATDFRLATSENSYALKGKSALSYVDNNNVDQTGYMINFEAGKISGNFQYNYNLEIISDKYNPNDMGYLWRGNEIINSATFSYNFYEPFSHFLNLYNSLSFTYKRNYSPDMFTSFDINYSAFSTLKNRMFISMWGSINPKEEHNLYVTEIPGRKIIWGKGYGFGIELKTDSRKTLTFSISTDTYQTYDFHPDYDSYSLSIKPGIKIGKNSEVFLKSTYEFQGSSLGVVNYINNVIYVGERNVNTFENRFGIQHKFNNDFSIDAKIRHYWSEVIYKKFHILSENGYVVNSTYSGNHNHNYNAFTIDFILRWNFMPGSEMSLVWKNSIYNNDGRIDLGYFKNLTNIFEFPQSNSISLKMLYYVDYLKL